MAVQRDIDEKYLRQAARLALRGHGGAEPNPLVGCVITNQAGHVCGWGFHRAFGGPHAEIEALRRAGSEANGGTLYTTLEPCAHTGKTGPCAHAIIEAKLARVVIGRRDPNPVARGGAEMLRQAGVEVDVIDTIPQVTCVSDPYVHTLHTHLPWVIAKWAQTLDGRIATREGDSKWISCSRSRRMVHRERGRVDVILTGAGTVLRDDPLLTARHGSVRRIARRAVIDPHLLIPLDSQLVRTARDAPVIVFCLEHTAASSARKISQLEQEGVIVAPMPGEDGIAPRLVLGHLAEKYHAATVLVEAGAGVLSRLFDENVVNEAWVFIAPRLLGDLKSLPVIHGRTIATVSDGIGLELLDQRRRGVDVALRFAVAPAGT